VHFERNVLSSMLASSTGEVAEEFVEIYGEQFVAAISVFEAGIEDALTYLDYQGSHHTRIRTTNLLGRLFEEQNESGVSLRGEREHVGYGDSLEEQ
jgi:hypothetical protein